MKKPSKTTIAIAKSIHAHVRRSLKGLEKDAPTCTVTIDDPTSGLQSATSNTRDLLAPWSKLPSILKTALYLQIETVLEHEKMVRAKARATARR